MSFLKQKPLKYDDGRTKQAFKDQTDINKIMKRAQKTGTISHLQKHGAMYGDFTDFDFQEAQNQLARAKSIFEELPSEVRREFNGNPSEFFAFANDPANVNKLAEVLPEVAEPGSYFPTVQRTAPAAPQATVEASSEAPVEPSQGSENVPPKEA